MKLDNRIDEWVEFSKAVDNHIRSYTIKQYGNINMDDSNKGDQLQNASLEDLQVNMKRYVNRMLTNSRGETEAIRDLLKLAHYSAVTWGKYMRNEISHYKTNKQEIENPSDEQIKELLGKNIKKIIIES